MMQYPTVRQKQKELRYIAKCLYSDHSESCEELRYLYQKEEDGEKTFIPAKLLNAHCPPRNSKETGAPVNIDWIDMEASEQVTLDVRAGFCYSGIRSPKKTTSWA